MANFKLDRFKYKWRGAWVPGIRYFLDDVINISGSSYVCIQQHTSAELFGDDLFNFDSVNNVPDPRWIKMTDGIFWKNTWQPNERYQIGDLVRYGGNVWICVEPYLADDIFDNGIENWTVYAANLGWTKEWQPNTRYGINDLVRYNGIVYRCVEGHTSASLDDGLPVDLDEQDSTLTKWVVYYENIEYRGDYELGKIYRKNDLVTYKGTLLRCVDEHTSEIIIEQGDSSTSQEIQSDKWQVELFGEEYFGDWQFETFYGIGSVVRHGGYLYYSLTNNYDRVPTFSFDDEFLDSSIDWLILSKGIRFRGTWEQEDTYFTGDVVRKGGNLYVALLDTDLFRDTGDSTLDFLDDTKWELLTDSQQWRNAWIIGRFYAAGDTVIYRGTTWQANFNHVADNQNFPGFTAEIFNFWDKVIQSGPDVGMSARGDLLTFDLTQEFAGDFVTQGPTGIPISKTPGDLLQVKRNNRVNYADSWGKTERRVYVAPNGVDDTSDPERGFVYYKPWKTIRFAAEWADDGFEGKTTIDVATGEYKEVLPIIVPSRTAIVGSELRSTTIGPNDPIVELENDAPFTLAVLERISNIIVPLLQGQPIQKTSTNMLDPVVLFDESGETPLPVSSAALSEILILISDISNYISFYLNNGESLPTVTGTNNPVTEIEYVNTVDVLNANKEFLKEEAVAFMKANFSTYDFEEALRKRDVARYVEAWAYDIIFTGNYKSILAARYYRNAVLGSKNEDMFYMRDASGARNFTAVGLVGELPTPTPENPYAIAEDAPSFFSLDPGWGPDDDRTWINTRSPYMQNVTNFGKGAIGQKLDGYLHNGGNRSFVSNDFTQVIDDGIGAWVYNVARAELVSVFTYYCNIGYLTTTGGIIRSTNGNNSYGNFGSVSIGVNPDEVPATATVNNRLNQAQVSSVFTGEFQDELQIFEWSNAGAEYTEAQAEITGAGIGAEVEFDDFRDRAVSKISLLDVSDPEDLAQDIGGDGYRVSRNTAQATTVPGLALTEIRLSVTEVLAAEQMIGMRIIITSGTGTGQYAEVVTFNSGTKVATVRRESDGEPGWDHLIPGTPLVNIFDNSTAYSIEPRVIFSEPEYSTQLGDFGETENWSAGAYGEIEQSFEIQAVVPTNLQERISEAAIFQVGFAGKRYVIESIISGGDGYKVGDIVLVTGDQLGGQSPLNDLTISITEVNNQNEITAAIAKGNPNSGRFVFVAKQSDAVAVSSNGSNWQTSSLPAQDDWKILVYGDSKFLAVAGNDSDSAAVSSDGIEWDSVEMPAEVDWVAGAYGNDRFVVISFPNDSSFSFSAVSENGESWERYDMPSADAWVDLIYARRKFIAIAESNNTIAISDDGISWDLDVIDLGSDISWASIAYGNNRFIAMSTTGEIRYSFNLIDWASALMPFLDDSTSLTWRTIEYSQGQFVAIAKDGYDEENNIIATSTDGLVWQLRELPSVEFWSTLTFGAPYIFDSSLQESFYDPFWILPAFSTSQYSLIRAGVRAQGRVVVAAGRIGEVKIWDSGSGYRSAPAVTFFDPNVITDAEIEIDINDGVLTNPTWVDRGTGYRVATTRTTITGDGFADILPVGRFVILSNLELLPVIGSQILFEGNDTIYTAVIVQQLNNVGGAGFTASVRISPELNVIDQLAHDTDVIIRRLFSQNRITSHDFLDVGTGNFETTNYPALYFTGIFTNAPENEVEEKDGGKVFYTATNEIGNFRAGELFEVEQATGIVTLSAEFFDFGGLSELILGGIRVGGSGVVIREFSTDPLLSADSNNAVSTQRAIARFLQNRLSVGGSAVEVPSIVAGQIVVGPDQIASAPGLKIEIQRVADFKGNRAGVRGSILAQTIFHSSFSDFPDDDMLN